MSSRSMTYRILIPGLISIIVLGCMYALTDLGAEDMNSGDAKAGSQGLRLILVRHAEAFRNLPDRDSVPADRWDTLTPRGVQQAEAVGKALKESGEQVATVLTAPTGRARQTATLVMKIMGLEGAPVVDPAVHACQAGESNEEKAARMLATIEKLEKKYVGKTVMIVTHQHLICCALDRAAQDDKSMEGKTLRCPPGSLTILSMSKDGWKLEKEPEVILKTPLR